VGSGSWHSTLEFELRSVQHFTTRAAARTRVSAWIEDYNGSRPAGGLGLHTAADVHYGRAAAVLAGRAQVLTDAEHEQHDLGVSGVAVVAGPSPDSAMELGFGESAPVTCSGVILVPDHRR
jgi:hypothetical protein